MEFNIYEITRDQIEGMHGNDFEDLVIDYYEKYGFEVSSTPKTNDFGSDLVVSTNTGDISIQCKRQTSNVGLKAVQEVYASMPKYNCNRGIVITTAGYTGTAVQLAEACGIELIDGSKFFQLIETLQDDKILIEGRRTLKLDMQNFYYEQESYGEFKEETEKTFAELNERYEMMIKEYNEVVSKAKVELSEQSKLLSEKVTASVNDITSIFNELSQINTKKNIAFDDRYEQSLEDIKGLRGKVISSIDELKDNTLKEIRSEAEKISINNEEVSKLRDEIKEMKEDKKKLNGKINVAIVISIATYFLATATSIFFK